MGSTSPLLHCRNETSRSILYGWQYSGLHVFLAANDWCECRLQRWEEV